MCALIFKVPIAPMGNCLRAFRDSRVHNCGAHAPVNYSRFVPQRPEISHHPPWENG
jgi:hypothetical protein